MRKMMLMAALLGSLGTVASAQTYTPRQFSNGLAEILDGYTDGGGNCAILTDLYKARSFPMVKNSPAKYVATLEYVTDKSAELVKTTLDLHEEVYLDMQAIEPWAKSIDAWTKKYFTPATPNYFYVIHLSPEYDLTGKSDEVHTRICTIVMAVRQ